MYSYKSIYYKIILLLFTVICMTEKKSFCQNPNNIKETTNALLPQLFKNTKSKNISILSCTNWLKTQSVGSCVQIGDLDISGNQITVEANINRNYTYSGGYLYAGDIVSKHTDPTDVNYLLRPNNAEITTTNGYFVTPPICQITLNKTYHVALVYNGNTLKFYRNGFLMSQIAASGNLYQNNLITKIGDWANYVSPIGTNFQGYINEVRIWNVPRTQQQLQTYMNTSLPNPSTQTGLQAYYTFDDLLNKQGNSAWNGTLSGAASISNTNSNCTLIADSCAIIPPNLLTSIIINDYTPILSLYICQNKITVEDGIKYNIGDTVLLIQMKGAIIDSTNTAAFGNITDYKSAGNYEFNSVKSRTGNVIELKNKILRSYEIPDGKVQLIRVPYFTNYVVTDTLTCLPWDGSKGGVLVFNVQNNLTLSNNIDVSGKGFKGGIDPVTNPPVFYCAENNYFYPPNADLASGKGEGIAQISSVKSFGKGAFSNAGGGGNSHNSGGGGGGNIGIGGNGGYQFEGSPCGGNIVDNRGIGGNSLTYNNSVKKIFMGGGGGAGQSNNFEGFQALGGDGSGIVIISADNLQSNGKKIIANGINGFACVGTGTGCHEGMGGGGGGGAILLNILNFNDFLVCESKGGKGGNMTNFGNLRVGPGGGGGGGNLWLTQSTLPFNVSANTGGGSNGVCTSYANDPWGATPGTNGSNLFNLILPISTLPFSPNIDSVKIESTSTSCNGFSFNGLGFTNISAIVTWQWNFGDGASATGQNTTHTYANTNPFPVKLIVTDINGCKDSIVKNIVSGSISVDAGLDKTFCGTQNSFALNAVTTSNGTISYSWTSTPTTTIMNSNSANATATVTNSTTFFVTVTNAQGCSNIDSVKAFINSIPIIKTLADTSICKGTNLQLITTSGLNTYLWSNGLYVSDSTIANPFFTDTLSHILVVTGYNGFCYSRDTIQVNVKPNPIVKTIPDTLICSTQSIVLTTSGANTYSWSPNVFLSSYNSPAPIFMGNVDTTYVVTGTAANGCTSKDTVHIDVNIPNDIIAPPDKSFCKNGSVILNGNNGDSYLYTWSPSTYLNNYQIINPVANPPATSTFKVNIKDKVCNYDSNFSVIVTQNNLPIILAKKSNDINCLLSSATLNVTGALQYIWNADPTLNNNSIPNPIASPLLTTTYIVVGIDTNGCKNTGKIEVVVGLDNNRFYLPNAFTPNGDYKNDCFGIQRFGLAQHVYFIIYNRWGEKVFETTNINICWDGKYKGKAVEPGNYVYYISAKTACGDIVKKGNVLLIR